VKHPIDVRTLFAGKSIGNRVNPGAIASSDPEKYKLLKAAAISYGLIADENGNTRRTSTAAELAMPPAGMVQISNELSTKAGLEPGAPALRLTRQVEFNR
jgi:hypothetical protein